MRNAVLSAALLLVPSVAAAKPAKAPKESSACGVELLPLVAGKSWTWQSLDDKVTLTILKVTPGDPTTIEVEEKLADRTLALTWTCNKDGLVVPPSSFLWLGEPGGGVGMELAITKREGVTYPVAMKGEWSESMTGTVTRKDTSEKGAVYPDATVELSRDATVGGTETIMLEAGSFKATKVDVELRGRAQIEEERYELAPTRAAVVWFQAGKGIVRYEDVFDRVWDLVPDPAVPAP